LHAWQEIFARIFADFDVQRTITPPWLVNPKTKRHLKLDLYYPQACVAIRFVGLAGSRRRRISDEEEELARQREDIRARLCQAQGITLVTVDLHSDDPRALLKEVASALGRAIRKLAQSEIAPGKAERLSQLAAARQRCEDLMSRIRRAGDLDLYAELWLDRQTAAIVATRQLQTTPQPPAWRYHEGQPVKHVIFGHGLVRQIEQRDDDTYITVAFATAGERTFAARLIGDKLLPQP
jgi:hypothetical protein